MQNLTCIDANLTIFLQSHLCHQNWIRHLIIKTCMTLGSYMLHNIHGFEKLKNYQHLVNKSNCSVWDHVNSGLSKTCLKNMRVVIQIQILIKFIFKDYCSSSKTDGSYSILQKTVDSTILNQFIYILWSTFQCLKHFFSVTSTKLWNIYTHLNIILVFLLVNHTPVLSHGPSSRLKHQPNYFLNCTSENGHISVKLPLEFRLFSYWLWYGRF